MGGGVNLIHLHKSLCDGGVVVDLEEVLARHSVTVTIVYGYGDRRHDVCGVVVVIVLRARDLKWCAGRIWL